MTISKDQISQLRSLGFKFRNRKRYSYLTSYNQFLSINIVNNGFQLEIDGSRIYTRELSFKDLINVINILFPNEKQRQRL